MQSGYSSLLESDIATNYVRNLLIAVTYHTAQFRDLNQKEHTKMLRDGEIDAFMLGQHDLDICRFLAALLVPCLSHLLLTSQNCPPFTWTTLKPISVAILSSVLLNSE